MGIGDHNHNPPKRDTCDCGVGYTAHTRCAECTILTHVGDLHGCTPTVVKAPPRKDRKNAAKPSREGKHYIPTPEALERKRARDRRRKHEDYVKNRDRILEKQRKHHREFNEYFLYPHLLKGEAKKGGML